MQKKEQLILKRENPTNVLIGCDDVSAILKKYDIIVPINDISHFRKAFVHRSYLKVNNIKEESLPECKVHLQDECNERLELLGDCILGSVVGTYLFTRFDDQSEGFLTKTKTKIVRGKTLGKLGRRMGFGKWVVISLHVENEGGRNNIRILEDLFECFIGALYLDNGGQPVDNDWFKQLKKIRELESVVHDLEKQIKQEIDTDSLSKQTITDYLKTFDKYRTTTKNVLAMRSNGYLICQKFIMNVLEKEIDLIKLIRLDDNYKDQLQHYYQKHFEGIFPEWKILKVEGPTNDRWHTVGVANDRGFLIGIGKARKKIEAEQKASKYALRHLGVEVLSDSDEEDEYYMKK